MSLTVVIIRAATATTRVAFSTLGCGCVGRSSFCPKPQGVDVVVEWQPGPSSIVDRGWKGRVPAKGRCLIPEL
ncbi:hypothetical protein BC835DRAFT_1324361, partial [Cytidiella melzeri]